MTLLSYHYSNLSLIALETIRLLVQIVILYLAHLLQASDFSVSVIVYILVAGSKGFYTAVYTARINAENTFFVVTQYLYQKFKIDYSLTRFSSMFHFYTPWKHQKTKGFMTFSEGIGMEY